MVAACAAAVAAWDDEITIDGDDIVITKSCVVKPGTYRVADANDNGIVRIKGDDITVDFQGAVIAGSADGAKPDEFKGWGVVAEGCRNLTVKNLVVRGVKIGMYFKNCDGLTVTGCDVSNNWKQHLKSTPRGEDGADWLFGHENDKNEWFRYGAGMYVEGSKKATLSRNRARNGQNGICIVRVDDSAVFDNDMSFMSGWGLAMWRSCRNDVSNNKFDWCMRGFSYKVYHRGQDSTGILIYEQCHDNVFAYNSATHGGDGFFLYAGNETLQRTGEGGCNRNLLYRNDFSHAAANGIEATFSDGNMFIENILDECDHGVWGGYSYNTVIVGNTIRNCNNGISIEHGHANLIEGNTFENCGTGVNLWWNPNDEFKKTAYGKKQDTLSHGYTIARNSIKGGRVGVNLATTTDVTLVENAIDAAVALRVNAKCKDVRADEIAGKVEGPAPEKAAAKVPKYEIKVPKTRGTQDAFLPKGALRGWRYIFVDDWGPYDFTSVRVFPTEVVAWGAAELFVLGPEGEFTVDGVPAGVKVEPASGKLPGSIRVSAEGSAMREFAFTVVAGKESVKVSGLLLSATWDVKFYGWESAGPHKPPKDWDAVVAGEPLASVTRDRIDNPWSGEAKVRGDLFATVASAEMELPAGTYEVRAVSDDGVRVRVGEKLVIDNWTWHGPTEDKATVKLEAGKHRIRIEHFEIDGHQELRFWLRPVR
jgi:parallel beta-helix repeat protein